MSHFFDSSQWHKKRFGLRKTLNDAGNILGPAARFAGRGVKKTGQTAWKGARALSESGRNMGWKAYGKNALFTGAIWGGISMLTSDSGATTDQKALHYAQYGTAAAADITVDIGLGLVASQMMRLGPVGAVAGAGLHAYNFLAGFVGIDPGTMVLNAMGEMDQIYDRSMKGGDNFRMSQTAAQSMQRQLSNLQGAGAGVAEMMHN